MSNHQRAVDTIEAAISSLATSPDGMQPVYSGMAYMAANTCHLLGAITGDEFLHYCDRIRRLDGLWLRAPFTE